MQVRRYALFLVHGYSVNMLCINSETRQQAQSTLCFHALMQNKNLHVHLVGEQASLSTSVVPIDVVVLLYCR